MGKVALTPFPLLPTLLLLFPLPSLSNLLWVHSGGDISVAVDSTTGAVAHVNASSVWGGWASDVNATSWLGEAPPSPLAAPQVSSCGPDGASVCVSRILSVVGQNPDGTCCHQYTVNVTDTFSPTPSPSSTPLLLPASVAWTMSVSETTSGLSWRTRIATDLEILPAGPSPANLSDAAFWMPRSGPRPGGWTDVTALLTSASAPNGLRTTYGDGFIYEQNISSGREVSPIPMTLAASLSLDAGLALFHDPADPLVAAYADVDPLRSSFSRIYNRLGAGALADGGVSFTMHFVPVKGADWRPAFAWARAAFPPFFLSASALAAGPQGWVPSAAAAAAATSLAPTPSPVPLYLRVGQGLYTCASGEDVNASYLIQAGATMNWDAHFFWPYIGQFMPQDATSWTSNTGSGEELDCGPHFTHGDTVDRGAINATYAAGLDVGLATLPYFNLFEFGENVQIVPAPVPPVPGPLAWQNASIFLAQNLTGSALPGPQNTGWQNGVVLDPGVKTFQDFLVEQAQDKLNSFGSLYLGLAVDRMDHTRAVNTDMSAGGDGWDVAWCGGPCRFLLFGWRQAMARVAAVTYTASPLADPRVGGGRIITVNYVGSQRVDTLDSVDGVFTEDYETGNHDGLVATVGLSTTGKPPAVIWTYSWEEIVAYGPGGPDAPDLYFQTHLFSKAFPCTPVLGADHTISAEDAGSVGQQYYLDYGMLFTALQGGCWHLAARPVAVEAGPAPGPNGTAAVAANAFTVGGGCTDPFTQNGNGPVSALYLFAFLPQGASSAAAEAAIRLSFVAPPGIPAAASPAPVCASLVPGTGAGGWTPLPAPVLDPSGSGRWGWWEAGQEIALGRGCVLVRCE
jgi:hypothetical protein